MTTRRLQLLAGPLIGALALFVGCGGDATPAAEQELDGSVGAPAPDVPDVPDMPDVIVEFDQVDWPDSSEVVAARPPDTDDDVTAVDVPDRGPDADSNDRDDDDDVSPRPGGLAPAPDGCDPPTGLPPAPLTEVAVDEPVGMVVHTFNVAPSADDKTFYVGGFSGLSIYADDGGGLVRLGQHPGGLAPSDSADATVEISPGWVATVRSNLKTPLFLFNLDLAARLSIVDVSDPTQPTLAATLALGDASDVAFQDDLLFITDPQGQLVVVDVSSPPAPIVVTTLPSLVLPRAIAISGPFAYVADMVLGLVVIDLALPTAPKVVKTIAVPGSAQHLMIDEGVLWLSLGAHGFQSYDLSNPGKPALLGRGATGLSVAGLNARGDRLWTAEHHPITVWDISEPATPRRLRSAPTDWFALDVLTLPDGDAVLAAWEEVQRWSFDGTPTAQLEVSRHGLFMSTDTGTTTFQIHSVGELDLVLAGISADVPGYQVLVEDTSVAPGLSVDVVLSWTGDGEPPPTTLCIASNDAAEPVRELLVEPASPAGALGPPLGSVAPDFILPDLSGDLHTLADYAGQPVLIVLFATWCPICHFELPDLQVGLWTTYQSQGFQVLAIGGSGESIGALKDFKKKYKITFPILFDDSGAVLQAYRFVKLGAPGTSPFPQDVLVDKDHIVIFRSSVYDPHAVEALLQPALEVQAW